MSDKSNNDFLSGFIVGGVIGALVAMLNTPHNGNEFKRELGKNYKLGLEKTGETCNELRDSLDDLQKNVEGKFSHVVDDLKDKAVSLSKRLEALTNRGARVLIEDEIV